MRIPVLLLCCLPVLAQNADKLWGGRFAEAPSKVFDQFSGSLHFDRKLIEADIVGSKAYARALSRVNILTPAEVDRIGAALDAVLAASSKPGFYDKATDEDIHSLVIRELKERAGGVADKIHTGRSRNEQISLDVRLWLRAEIDATRGLTTDLMAALLAQADAYPEAIVPGFTHTRRAQPVLWGHYLHAYFEMFARDLDRLGEVRKRVNLMPMGSGALAGAAFDYDRAAMSRELGFDGLTRNSMDVSADRDFVIDTLHASALIMQHLSRLSEDWILYSSDEFGWLDLSDKVTSGSSLMPQKKNPDSLELIRGKYGRVFGAYTAVMSLMKGLPLTYNRDMQEDKEPLFDALASTQGSLAMARNVVETAKLRPAVALKAVEESWSIATDLAEELARRGTPFHQAHRIVGRLVMESIKAGKKPAEWTGPDLQRFDAALQPDLVKFMNPAEGLKTRNVLGGTAPGRVRDAIAEAKTRLAVYREAIGR
jgi:argininosuccinate lyase